MDRRQVTWHAAFQKSAERTRPRRDEAWGMTRSRSGAVETHPPKSPPNRALYRWGGNEGGAATRRPRVGRLGITRVIVLRSDPPPKQEVNGKCSVFLPYDTERPIDGKIQRR